MLVRPRVPILPQVLTTETSAEKCGQDLKAVEPVHVGLGIDAVQVRKNHYGPPLRRILLIAFQVQLSF